MVGIYKITSPKGRVYIGQSYDLKARFKVYKKLKCKMQIRLYNSFIKYGVDKHKFDIVVECEIAELNDKERYYQDLYDVLGKHGLNCKLTKTKDRCGKHSAESIEKMSQNAARAMTGVPMSEANRKFHSERMKNTKLSESTKEKLRQYGLTRKASEDTKRKMSIANKGKVRSEAACKNLSEAKKKIILDFQTGIFYKGVEDASIAFGINIKTLNNYLIGHRRNKTSLQYV